MNIGKRLFELRTAKDLSQGDIEKRTGLKRCYTSRVENGHTVPSIKTLQRFCKAFDVSLFEFFHSSKETRSARHSMAREPLESLAKKSGKAGGKARFLLKMRRRLLRLAEKDRNLFLALARTLATP